MADKYYPAKSGITRTPLKLLAEHKGLDPPSFLSKLRRTPKKKQKDYFLFHLS
jgi:hypothetical protein